MTYSNDVVTKGNSYEVYRKGILLKQNWHGIIDNISNSGHLHIGFLGIADIQKGDILKDSDNHTYYVIHTALKTLYSKNDKLLIICEPNDVRQKKLNQKLHKEKMKILQEKNQRRHDYLVATFSAIIAAIISNFDRIIKFIMELTSE
jgi:hypothetical protein